MAFPHLTLFFSPAEEHDVDLRRLVCERLRREASALTDAINEAAAVVAAAWECEEGKAIKSKLAAAAARIKAVGDKQWGFARAMMKPTLLVDNVMRGSWLVLGGLHGGLWDTLWKGRHRDVKKEEWSWDIGQQLLGTSDANLMFGDKWGLVVNYDAKIVRVISSNFLSSLWIIMLVCATITTISLLTDVPVGLSRCRRAEFTGQESGL